MFIVKNNKTTNDSFRLTKSFSLFFLAKNRLVMLQYHIVSYHLNTKFCLFSRRCIWPHTSRPTATVSSQLSPIFCKSFLTVLLQCVLDRPGHLLYLKSPSIVLAVVYAGWFVIQFEPLTLRSSTCHSKIHLVCFFAICDKQRPVLRLHLLRFSQLFKGQ